MEINQAIRIFALFLNASWDIVKPLHLKREYTSDESSIDDWLQINWEILVEKKVLPINEYLEPYGSGADYNGASSRMNDIEALPTHTLKLFTIDEAVDILNNEIIRNKAEFEFDRLVGFQNGFYMESTPFEYVLVRDNIGMERVFLINDVQFRLEKI